MKSFFQFLRPTLVCALAFPFPSLVNAARPMVTDDASILETGQCQVEGWSQRGQGGSEIWAVPHCNISGLWELAVGSGRLSLQQGQTQGAGLIQAKTVFRQLKPNDWGVGLAVSDQLSRGSSTQSINVPTSISLADDALVLHANAGWRQGGGTGRGATWATGAELNATEHAGMTLEAYGGRQDGVRLQVGARYALVPGHLVLDGALSRRISSRAGARLVSFGLTFMFSKA